MTVLIVVINVIIERPDKILAERINLFQSGSLANIVLLFFLLTFKLTPRFAVSSGGKNACYRAIALAQHSSMGVFHVF